MLLWLTGIASSSQTLSLLYQTSSTIKMKLCKLIGTNFAVERSEI